MANKTNSERYQTRAESAPRDEPSRSSFFSYWAKLSRNRI